jgi:hypothetical protein
MTMTPTGSSWRRLWDRVSQALTLRPSQVKARLDAFVQSRSWLAPLRWTIATLVLLFRGLVLIVSNWRLTLVMLVPAVAIGLTWWDLRAHLLGRRPLATLDSAGVALAVAVGIVAVTVAAYWCNGVFAVAISSPEPTPLRDAFRQTRTHRRYLNAWGIAVGTAHALVSTVLVWFGTWWFSIGIFAVAVVMTVTFFTVPAHVVGLRTHPGLSAKARGAVVVTALALIANLPGFVLIRIGLLMLGVDALKVPGVLLFAIGVALQTAAVSSIRALHLTTSFVDTDPSTEPG